MTLPKLILSISVLLLWAFPTCAGLGPQAGDWDLKKFSKRHKVAVYTRDLPDFEYDAFLGVVVVESTIPAVLTLLNDTGSMHKWLYRMDAEFIEQKSPSTNFIYIRSNLPMPILDRDAVLFNRITREEKDGSVTIFSQSVHDVWGEKPGYVRAENIYNEWRIIPIGEGKLRIESEGYGDPAGKVPAWFVNLFLTKTPYIALKNIRKMLGRSKYADTRSYLEYAVANH